VKWNVLSILTWLFSHMRPPIFSTSRLVMDSPSPVPPNRREMELSTCVKASKMALCLSIGMPMPVSLTAK